ncbi:MAG: MFS transporter [Dehalococcoidia bacterium]|nr:MFS transporter [Dehalococcoidia bacterium]
MRKSLYHGYKIVGAGFLIQAAGGGALATYGIFFTHLQAEFHWSRAAISGATSITILLMGTAAILVGRLNDRIGPRLILYASGLLLGIGYVLVFRLQYLWQLYAAIGVVVGMGMSTQDVVILSTIARWFERRRGMMSGIVKTGTGLGQLAFPLVIAALILAYGWRQAYLLMGLAVTLVAMGMAHFFRRDPASMGQIAIGRKAATASSETDMEEGVTSRIGIRTKQFWFLCLAEFTLSFCIMTTLVHLVPHAQDGGVSVGRAGILVSVIGASSIVARLAMGSASDSMGSRRAFSICFGVLLIGLLWLQMASNMWMLVIYAVADGFARGGNFAVISPLVAELFGTRAHGALFGLATFVGTIGGALGPVLTGRIFDIAGSYDTAFALLAGLIAIGFVLTLLIRPLTEQQAQG